MAENKYHPIDINNWDRRDLYDYFSRLKLPHFAVAAYIDVTRLLEYKRHEGLSFYLSLIYLTTKVLNGIDNFRLRIIDGQVVSFDTIHTNFTHKCPEEEVFRFHTAPFEGTLRQYVETTSKAKSWQGKHGMQGITELFHPWAWKSFYWMHGRRQIVFEKIQGIRNLVLAECGLH